MKTLKVYPKHEWARHAFMEVFRTEPKGFTFRIPSLIIVAPNGDEIRYSGGDNPEAFRGCYYDRVWIHEQVSNDKAFEFRILERPSK